MKAKPTPKFRETLWFKKGELDADAAQDAADGDGLKPDAVDLLPLEDRYLDNGSVTGRDSAEFGVHSGQTQHMAPLDRVSASDDGGDLVDVRQLVGEMRRGRRAVLAAMGAAVLALGLAVLFAVA